MIQKKKSGYFNGHRKSKVKIQLKGKYNIYVHTKLEERGKLGGRGENLNIKKGFKEKT